MQIHEVTKSSLKEGALSNIGRGFVQGLTGANFARDQVVPDVLDQQTRARAKQLTQAWMNQVKRMQQPTATTKPATAPKPAAATQTPGQPVMLGGKRLDPRNPNDAKVLAAMQSQGKLQEAPAEYTTPSGIIIPAGSKTDSTQSFLQWADSQLTGQVSGTSQTIDMNTVRKNPEAKARLDKILSQIEKDPTDATAVEEYFVVAMQALQQISAEVKQTVGKTSPATTNPLNRIINDQQLQDIKKLIQNPQTADTIKQILGIK